MCKISIIVPVYGVEDYIERCARSLFEQTFDDIEYIFVDDSSPDNSISILECIAANYPQRKKSVKIIRHDVNQGLPSTRHTGLLNATGDYILHCDSDDWLDLNACAILYDKAIKTDSDVVVFDIARTDGQKQIGYTKGTRIDNVDDFVIDMMLMKSSWSVVNKLFKREVYSVVWEYPKYGVGEDLGLCMQLIHGCKKMSFVDMPLYNYYINPKSLTHDVTEEKALKRYRECKSNADLVISFYDNYVDEEFKSFLFFIKWSVRYTIWGLVHNKNYFELWRNTYPEVDREVLLSRHVRLSEKLRLCLTYLKLYPRKKNRISLK